jgi:LysM repeat protein
MLKCSKCGSQPIPERYAGMVSLTKCPSGGTHDFQEDPMDATKYVTVHKDTLNSVAKELQHAADEIESTAVGSSRVQAYAAIAQDIRSKAAALFLLTR